MWCLYWKTSRRDTLVLIQPRIGSDFLLIDQNSRNFGSCSVSCYEMKMKWKIDTLEMLLIALKIYFVPWCDNWSAIRQTEDSVCIFKEFSFYIMLSNSDMALRSAVFLLFSPSLSNHLASSRTSKSWKFATAFSWRYAFYIFSLNAEYSNSCFLKSVI